VVVVIWVVVVVVEEYARAPLRDVQEGHHVWVAGFAADEPLRAPVFYFFSLICHRFGPLWQDYQRFRGKE
jgi:hypothetical protein